MVVFRKYLTMVYPHLFCAIETSTHSQPSFPDLDSHRNIRGKKLPRMAQREVRESPAISSVQPRTKEAKVSLLPLPSK